MRKMNLHKIILYISVIWMLAFGLAGCGNGAADTESSQEETESETQDELYLIMKHNSQEETFTLYSMTTGKTYEYEYGFSTKFKDKYGKLTSATQFFEGRFTTIAPCDKDGYLTELMLSNQVWEHSKVRRFQIDEDKGVFTIGDTKYSIQNEVKIFSNGELISFSDISQDDVLTVVGVDRKILTVVVTTGHGILSLSNTELFEDSFLQLNNNIFAMITSDMEMEVPEGTYTLTVANDGWGGSTQITIVRGETTEVDLDALKGEGKKKGLISFKVDVDNVKISVDYKEIDPESSVELTYGMHVLEVSAPGYEKWKKYLSVNSAEATIIIELTEDSASEETEATETTEESNKETEEENTETEDTEKPSESSKENEKN